MAGLAEFFISNWQYLAASFVIGYLSKQYFNHGLNSVPGPFLAKFTNLWRVLEVRKGNFHDSAINLHRKYGNFVRMGPNVVSIADPDLIREIYGFGNKGLPKSKFYDAFRIDGKGPPLPPSLFGVQDEKIHGVMRRPIAGAYSMTTLVQYEPLVDVVIEEFQQQLESRFATGPKGGQECDIAAWLQYYAFDVIGQITWGETIGFLKNGSDIGGAMREILTFQTMSAVTGQMPFLVKILKQNAIARRFDNNTNFFPRMAIDIIQKRQKESGDIVHKDFLTSFLAAAKQSPTLVDPPMLVGYLMNNIIAGSDTTAISLRAIIYYVLKTPNVYRKLMEELEAANLSSPVSWAKSQDLPYLDAVIKEALRLHPAVGLGLERVVTDQGLRLSNGKLLQGGTEVSINAWVVHRNTRIFGADAEKFNPSRWLHDPNLESHEKYQDRISAMKRTDLTFGGGSRTCIGKNISLLEIYKAIPTIFLKFEISLVNPVKDWKVINYWFTVQSDMDVYLRLR